MIVVYAIVGGADWAVAWAGKENTRKIAKFCGVLS